MRRVPCAHACVAHVSPTCLCSLAADASRLAAQVLLCLYPRELLSGHPTRGRPTRRAAHSAPRRTLPWLILAALTALSLAATLLGSSRANAGSIEWDNYVFYLTPFRFWQLSCGRSHGASHSDRPASRSLAIRQKVVVVVVTHRAAAAGRQSAHRANHRVSACLSRDRRVTGCVRTGALLFLALHQQPSTAGILERPTSWASTSLSALSLAVLLVGFVADRGAGDSIARLLWAVGATAATVAFIVAGAAPSATHDRCAQPCFNALCSTPPMRYVGKVSYHLYLWHWPTIIYARQLHATLAPRHTPPALRGAVGGFALAAGLFAPLFSCARLPLRPCRSVGVIAAGWRRGGGGGPCSSRVAPYLATRIAPSVTHRLRRRRRAPAGTTASTRRFARGGRGDPGARSAAWWRSSRWRARSCRRCAAHSAHRSRS
jgi:peptidoglycan/LPS O-acetylase OafA/YrhL